MYLHAPRRDPGLIRALVDGRVSETADLDFKSEWWKNERGDTNNPARITSFAKEESSKDVAALANSRGGDILVGIQEDRRTGQAARFGNNPSIPRDPWKDLHDWLEASLLPSSVMNTVTVEVVDVPDAAGVTHPVCVVTVPPWPHGPVGVRRAEGEGFYFPYRDGPHTRFMEPDEVIARAEAGSRAIFLKLLQLREAHGSEVVIASPLAVSWWPDANIQVPPGDRDGRIVELNESIVRLEMYARNRALDAAKISEARRRLSRHVAATRPEALLALRLDEYPKSVWDEAEAAIEARMRGGYNPVLVIPLSLIQDVWAAGAPPQLNFLVRCTAILAGGRWTLAPSG